MQYLVGAWNGLSATGKTVAVIVVGVVVVVALLRGVDLTPVIDRIFK